MSHQSNSIQTYVKLMQNNYVVRNILLCVSHTQEKNEKYTPGSLVKWIQNHRFRHIDWMVRNSSYTLLCHLTLSKIIIGEGL